MSMKTAVAVATAAKLFRGFADPTRLAILLALVDDEQRVKDLVELIGGSQGNVSGHVACLKECGLIIDRHEGRQVFYRAAHPEILDPSIAQNSCWQRPANRSNCARTIGTSTRRDRHQVTGRTSGLCGGQDRHATCRPTAQ